jgi:hypothetical protein
MATRTVSFHDFLASTFPVVAAPGTPWGYAEGDAFYTQAQIGSGDGQVAAPEGIPLTPLYTVGFNYSQSDATNLSVAGFSSAADYASSKNAFYDPATNTVTFNQVGDDTVGNLVGLAAGTFIFGAAGVLAASGAGEGLNSIATTGEPTLLSQASSADIALGGQGGTLGGQALIDAGYGAAAGGAVTSIATSGQPSTLSQATQADISLGGAGGTQGGQALIDAGYGAAAPGASVTLSDVVSTVKTVGQVAGAANSIGAFINGANGGVALVHALPTYGGASGQGASSGNPSTFGGSAPAFADTALGQVAIGVAVALALGLFFMGAH